MSTTGWLLVLMIAGFALMCLFRMVPAYVDNHYIKQALVSLADEGQQIETMSTEEIRRHIGRFFQMNNIRSQSEKSVEVERRQENTLVTMKYEVRVPVIYNVDAVMTFNNEWDSSRPHECCTPAERK